jgi:hypothetical protein
LDLIFYDQIFPLWVYEDKGKFLQKLFLVKIKSGFICKVIQKKSEKKKEKDLERKRRAGGSTSAWLPKRPTAHFPPLPEPVPNLLPPAADKRAPPVIPPGEFGTNTASNATKLMK